MSVENKKMKNRCRSLSLTLCSSKFHFIYRSKTVWRKAILPSCARLKTQKESKIIIITFCKMEMEIFLFFIFTFSSTTELSQLKLDKKNSSTARIDRFSTKTMFPFALHRSTRNDKWVEILTRSPRAEFGLFYYEIHIFS